MNSVSYHLWRVNSAGTDTLDLASFPGSGGTIVPHAFAALNGNLYFAQRGQQRHDHDALVQ